MPIEFSEMKSLMTLLPFLYLHFSLLIILSITSSTTSAASPLKTPRLRAVLHETFTRGPSQTISASSPEDFEISFYPQTLDHFNFQPQSYAIFQQKYVINSKYWGGANESAPIFVLLGAESPLDESIIDETGFLLDNAPHFKALVVYIEHRFYGQSIPFGTFDEAMNDAKLRGYFNSAQALADYAELIIHLKKKLFAHNSPVIVVGGSYGGMLATWFRLKYPHVALGALASSAPILYIDKIAPYDGYNLVVQKDFRETSESCYQTIRKSWSEIHRVASEPNSLWNLSQTFRTCKTLSSAADLESYLILLYERVAQYDSPPSYPVTQICGGIDGAKQGTDILGKIFAGLVALQGTDRTCYLDNIVNSQTEADKGWEWQMCSELIMPTRYGTKATMFPPIPFSFKEYSSYCISKYGVSPRPHWVTTYYGGHDIKLVLRRFGSNIIFSNGLRDPFSSGGVLKNLSDTLLAVYTTQGSHCLDIRIADKTDPKWLIQQRKEEVKIITGWLKMYYADLHALAK